MNLMQPKYRKRNSLYSVVQTTLIVLSLLVVQVRADGQERRAGAETKAQTGVTLPDTPAGNQFRDWFAAFSTGDRNTVRQFLMEHRSTPPAGAPSIDAITNRQVETD